MVLSEENNLKHQHERYTLKILELEQKLSMLSDENRIAKENTNQDQSKESFEILYEISKALHNYPNVEDAFRFCVKSICEYLNICYGEIWSKNIDNSNIVFRANWAANEKAASFRTSNSRTTIAKGKGLAGTAWEQKKKIYFNNILESPLIDLNFAKDAGLVACMSIPIFFDDEVIAILSFFSDQPFSEKQFNSELINNVGMQIGVDIEKRRNDTALNNFFNLSPNFLVIAGMDGYFKKINPAVSKILKYTQEELLSHPYINFVHPEDINNTITKGHELHNGASIFTFENRYITKDGETKWISWTATSKDDENLIYAVGKDETENIQAKTLLEEQNKQLLKTNSELDQFVYSVSHDLRSPITSVLGLLQFIEEESQEKDTLEHVSMIKSRIRRLDIFIQNILHYSRNNRVQLAINKISFADIINTNIALLKSIPEVRKLNFEFHINEKIEFFSDANRISTIFENILGNAIKFHRYNQDYPFVRIKITTSENDAEIIIEDNGIGIDEVNHEKIFDMFFRINGKISGAGLGLYIVKEIVEKLEGTISVKSSLGEGSTFIIKLKNMLL